jgi:hypothetical protein
MTVKRVRFIQELLRFVGLEGRVHLEWISSAEAGKFVQVVTEFTETIRRLGPNPIQRTVRPFKASGPRRLGTSSAPSEAETDAESSEEPAAASHL